MRASLRNPLAQWIILAGLVLLFLLPRIQGLGRFATIDEVYWLKNSANFRQAILAGDWEGTAISQHPGVTTLWAGFLGIQARFPQLDALPREGVTDFHLRHYLWQHSVNPIEVIASQRLFIVLLCAAAFAFLWFPLRRLFGDLAAVLILLLVALDPFLIAHQRLLHQDGLMAAFGLLALVSSAAYLKDRGKWDLAVSAISVGLACLTKSPMLLLFPLILGLFLWQAWRDGRESWRNWLKDLALWGALAGLVFFILWPAMWVQPIDSLSGIASYAQSSAEGELSGPIFFNGVVYPDGKLGAASWLFYPLSLLWRTTPAIWLGLLAAAGLLLWRASRPARPTLMALGLLAAFALLFVAIMSLGDKKFDRYMLPAYAALFPIAGWGLASLVTTLWHRLRQGYRQAIAVLVLVIVILIQAGSAFSARPYYLDYYNPLLGGPAAAQQVMMQGWGEGLEQAAVYLRDNAPKDAQIAAWYSNLFDLFYGSDVQDIPIALQLSPEQLAETLASDYLVIYIHQWQRGTPQNLLDALNGMKPEYRVLSNGLELVRVYHLPH